MFQGATLLPRLARSLHHVAPWHEDSWFIVKSDDKKRARLNCVAHFLSQIPYESVRRQKIEMVAARASAPTTTRPR